MVTETSDNSRTVTRASIAQNQRIWLDRYGTWQRFHRRARQPGMPLLKRLPRYPRCVLVAGCRRSGTTMLTRVLADAQYDAGYARLVQQDSANKADRLSSAARRRIEQIALPTYRECSALAADLRAA